jgi:predicted PurR-regulated permease PerM
MDSPRTRRVRLAAIQISGALLAVTVAVLLLWSLRAIILPVLVGAFVAYLCIPMVNWFESKGARRTLSILLLFALFLTGLTVAVRQIQRVLPDDRERLELRIRVQYKINEAYARLMGLDETLRKGNALYQLAGGEVDPFVDRLNMAMLPNPDEREILRRVQAGEFQGRPPVSERVFQYYVANTQTIKKRLERALTESDPAQPAGALDESLAKGAPEGTGVLLSAFREIFSTWLIMPFVFLFLLLDDGRMKRQLVRLIPNRYFELTLTLVDDMDRAIGAYVRGTLAECSLVGASFLAGFTILGFDPQWTLALSVLAGVFNAIPYVGAVAGLGGGLAYSLLAEQIHPLLPFINMGNVWVWVVVAVVLVKAADDAVFVPVVLGGAVELHPMVMILGIVGGSILFGVAGTLFAIPAIVVVRVFVTSVLKQLKAYYII